MKNLEESRTLYCSLVPGCLVVFQHLTAAVINLSSGCRHDQPTTFADVDFVASALADASRSGIFLNARASPLATVALGGNPWPLPVEVAGRQGREGVRVR
jgi:hypothetical protein